MRFEYILNHACSVVVCNYEPTGCTKRVLTDVKIGWENEVNWPQNDVSQNNDIFLHRINVKIVEISLVPTDPPGNGATASDFAYN